MRLARPRVFFGSVAVFVFVAVSFVYGMRSCAKSLWPDLIFASSSHRDRALSIWTETHAPTR